MGGLLYPQTLTIWIRPILRATLIACVHISGWTKSISWPFGWGAITLEYAEEYPAHLGKGILIAPAVFEDRDEKKTETYLELWKDDPKYKDAIESVRRYRNDPKTDAKATKQLESIIRLYFSR